LIPRQSRQVWRAITAHLLSFFLSFFLVHRFGVAL